MKLRKKNKKHYKILIVQQFKVVLFFYKFGKSFAKYFTKKNLFLGSFLLSFYVPVLWYFLSDHKKKSRQGTINSAPINGDRAYTIFGKLP